MTIGLATTDFALAITHYICDQSYVLSTICPRFQHFSVAGKPGVTGALDKYLNIFFSSHYTTPAQCWAQDLARGCTLPGLHGYTVVAGWGRPAGVSWSVHPHIRTLSVHPR